MRATRIATIGAFAVLVMSTAGWAGEWNPAAWTTEETIELQTNCPDEGRYAFPVWLVVIDGQAYIRLGSKAAGRIDCNQSKPYMGVKIAGQQFDRVKGEDAADKKDAVAKAMGDKYTSDIFVRYFSHPMTLRLVVE